MPQYDFKCTNCDHKVSVTCSMSEYEPLEGCFECGELDTMIRDYDGYGLGVKGDPTTLGALAEANTKKMGHYGLEKAKEEERRKRKQATPEQLKDFKENMKIAKMTPKQKHHYIMTGEGL